MYVRYNVLCTYTPPCYVRNNIHLRRITMKMSDERKQYLKEYRGEKLKRIPLDVPQSLYERIKAAASAEDKSVNGLIKFLVSKYLDAKGF